MKTDSRLEAEVLFELLMHVGGDLDLDQMLRDFVPALLRLLSGRGAQVLAASPVDGSGDLHWRILHSEPRPLARSKDRKDFLEEARLPARLAEWTEWSKRLPLAGGQGGRAYLLFDLPGFGALLLETAEPETAHPVLHSAVADCTSHGVLCQTFPASFLRSLQPVFDRLAVACRGCLEDTERRATQARLRESEERFRLLAENSTDMISHHDAQGKFLYASPACHTLTGYEPEELLGHSAFEFIHPDDLQHVELSRLGIVRQPMVSTTEFRLRRKDGRYAWLETTSRTIVHQTTGDVLGIHASTRDITARKLAQVELEHLKRKDEEALRVAHMGHWEFDIGTGEFLFNDQYYSLHGTTAEAAGGYSMSAQDFARTYVHPDDAPMVAKAIQQGIDANDPSYVYKEQGRILRADAEPRNVIIWFRIAKDTAGRTVKLYGVNQDITELKQAEAALRLSEENQRTLIAALPDVIMRFDRDGRHLFTSENVTQVTGIPASAFIGKTHRELGFPEAMCALWEHAIQQPFSTGLPYETEFTLDSPTGRILYNWRLAPDLDERGHVRTVLAIARDITEKARAEEVLREYQRRLADVIQFLPDATLAIDGNRRIIVWNRALEEMTGIQAAAMIGQGDNACSVPFYGERKPMLMDLVLGDPAGRAEGAPAITREGDTLTAEEFCKALHAHKGAWVFAKAAPLYDTSGKIIGAIESIRDITERKRAAQLAGVLYEISRVATEAETLDQLYRAVHRIICTVIQVKNFYIALHNPATGTIVFPYFVDEIDPTPPSRTMGKGLTEYVLRTGKSLLCDEAMDARLREAGEIETVGAPSPIWIGVPLVAGKRVLGVMAIQDYTDANAFGRRDLEMLEFISEQTAQAIERQGHIEQLRVSLAEKVVLLKEVHHRVKNNMQVITSLLNLGAMEASAGGSQQVLRESMDRIRSMALVHERLYQSDNMASIEFGEYLQSVAAGLARSFRREGITCNVTADKVLLDVDRAIPCGLIANELISNSMKHGFPQRNTGRIDVSLRKPASGTIELAVQDDGVGFPADRPFERMTSMGMTLVKSLTDQIMGSIELTSDHGTRFCITFPEVSAR